MNAEKSSASLFCLLFCKHAWDSEGVLSSELVKVSQAGSAHRAPEHRLGLPGLGEHFCACAPGHPRVPAVLSL